MQSGDTVYLVTAGEYSNYRVVAVCSTKASAEAVIERYHGPEERRLESSGIEEYVLDRPWEAPQGCWVTHRADRAWWDADAIIYDNGRISAPWDGRYGARVQCYENGTYQIRAYGRTKEHAMRAYREMDRAIKAGTVIPSPDFDLLSVDEG